MRLLESEYHRGNAVKQIRLLNRRTDAIVPSGSGRRWIKRNWRMHEIRPDVMDMVGCTMYRARDRYTRQQMDKLREEEGGEKIVLSNRYLMQ